MDEIKIRGFLPDDDKTFNAEMIRKLKSAQSELYFLLNRGYRIKSAVTFIGNHHQLTTRQALALTRATASAKNLLARNKKQLLPKDLDGQTVYIDGFNLIITLEVALSNGMLFIGQDGCIRDLAELRGTYRLIPQTEAALKLICDTLQQLHVVKAVFFLDQPVSNSGRLKTTIYETDWHIPVEVQIVRSPDAILKRLPNVITSDSIILDGCVSWFNLVMYILRNDVHFNLYDAEINLLVKKLTRLVYLNQLCRN